MAYKAESAGRIFREIEAAGTSQECICGATVAKELKDRRHECSVCGLAEPRDLVSAKVILGRGLRLCAPSVSPETLAQEAARLEPAE
jgi:putative transposase